MPLRLRRYVRYATIPWRPVVGGFIIGRRHRHSPYDADSRLSKDAGLETSAPSGEDASREARGPRGSQ